jgi:hypothetical protein
LWGELGSGRVESRFFSDAGPAGVGLATVPGAGSAFEFGDVKQSFGIVILWCFVDLCAFVELGEVEVFFRRVKRGLRGVFQFGVGWSGEFGETGSEFGLG